MAYNSLQDFKTLAQYNQWANTLLYASCAKLDSAEYFQDRKAFFQAHNMLTQAGLIAPSLDFLLKI